MGRHLGHPAVTRPLSFKRHRSPRFLRRFVRHGFRQLGIHPYRIVFHERYDTTFPGLPVDPLRADRILAFLASEGFVLRSSVFRPEAVWMKALAKVHSAEYLDALHHPNQLARIMGSDIEASQVDRMIDYQRLQTGGTLMATRRARDSGIGVNLGGGFHHAHADHGGGFCIFNDVAAAIFDERRRGFRGRILVIDLDLHDGDGTRSLFAHDDSVHTFSIHARHWGETDAVESTSLALGGRVDDETYLKTLRTHLPPLVARFKPQLVFYLAGTDVAHDDTLGNWQIHAAAMLERDQMVVRLCRRPTHPIPLAILLAGGYSQETWRYTARFLANMKSHGRVLEPPTTDEITFKRYRYISKLTDPRLLSGGSMSNEFGLSEEDLYLPGWGQRQEHRFLGFYTKTGIELFMERSGFLDRLRQLGFQHPCLELQLNDPAGDTVRFFADPDHQELLGELRVQRDRRLMPGFELLSVEWLMMQNPRATFSGDHKPLPGQEHPGLGMLGDVIAVLRLICDRLRLDGMSFVPSTYLTAAYGEDQPLRFLEAEDQARFEALQHLFRGMSVGKATLAMARGDVLNEADEVVSWQPKPMVLPINRRLRQALGERHEAHPAQGTYRFHLASMASQSGSLESVE